MKLMKKVKNVVDVIFHPSIYTVRKWYKDNAEWTLRYDYCLDENSLVLDLGGYKGDFTKEIVDRYHCKVMIFEPVPEFANNIKTRFINESKVSVYTFGLEDIDSIETLYLSDNGSSTFRNNQGEALEIVYRDVETFFNENNISSVNLMKINIEGGEYALLEKMIKSNLVSRVDNFQIQFHNIKGLNSKKRMKNIWKELEKTHFVTWKYRPFVWENWKRK